MPVQQISVKNSSTSKVGNGAVDVAGKRCAGSGSSRTSCSNSSGDICRICHCESEAHNPLLAPCYCSGSLKYVHQSCLQQWLTASETRSCELCKFNFIMHTKIKPFNEWRLLEMSGVERRRLCCAVLFHCVAALCVMWSLFVLIERAVEEVNRGSLVSTHRCST
ncbi:RING-variant domain-containing protein [Phthorimaea operculella]|nr:RING-variant domain-containing protein [Phthorimaea operculella]